MSTAIALGLIPGFGFHKAVSATCTVRIPAIAIPAPDPASQSELDPRFALVTLPDGSRWIVGEEALSVPTAQHIPVLDRNRYHEPRFLAVLQATLHAALPTDPAAITLCVGMPSVALFDQSARAALEAAIHTAIAPHHVAQLTIVSEAAGIYYADLFEGGQFHRERRQGLSGVIDIGFRDFTIALFADGKPVLFESRPGGMVTVMRAVRSRIASSYGLELSEHEVDAALRNKQVRLGRRLVPLPVGTDETIRDALGMITTTARSLWPDGGQRIPRILCGGGGAPLLVPHLIRAFPNAEIHVPDLPAAPLDLAPTTADPEAEARWSEAVRWAVSEADPQLAGPRGLYWMAEAQLLRQRTVGEAA
ncbi:MAG: hypothetical protein AB4911_16350 [Oscillochloridaceae bacterium umkhey_bin13]